jgi:transaldolase
MLAAGISVNVTLIFSLQRYNAVMDAFLDGLEQARANGHELAGIASVASFFVSRVDTEVDKRLGADHPLRGKAAVANARLAYQHFQRMLASPRWASLAAAGARPQRPLWASTGVKDPAYEDTRYVVELVAAGTVNTMPEATLDAVADHAVLRGDTITGAYEDAHHVLAGLAQAGIGYQDVVELLEREGVQKFADSWAQLSEEIATALTKSED